MPEKRGKEDWIVAYSRTLRGSVENWKKERLLIVSENK